MNKHLKRKIRFLHNKSIQTITNKIHMIICNADD